MENKMPFLGIINCRNLWKIDYHLHADAPKIKINLFYLVHGHILLLLNIMYIYHRLPDYTTSCIAILSLIQHIAVTLMGRSKTVVEFFPIAAFCRVLPNKSQQEHVFYPLPWQTNKTLIISKILV